jgi:hypothetical protein
VSGTPACQNTTLIYYEASDDFTLTLEPVRGAKPAVVIHPNADGHPSVGDLVGPSNTVDCAVTVRDGAKAWYPYYEDPRAGVSLRGSCKVTFTQLASYVDSGTVVSYRFQGTMTAHLLPLESTGATGTVDVVMNFAL